MNLQAAIERNREWHRGLVTSDAQRIVDTRQAHAVYAASAGSDADWWALGDALGDAATAHTRRVLALRKRTGRVD